MYANKLCLVLGLGETGLAMAQWLTRCGASVRVADSRSMPPGADDLRQRLPQAELVCGPFADSLLEGVALVALSPGLDQRDPLIQAAHAQGLPVTGEIELFAEALRELGWRDGAKVIAITGTNGKTTTTSLVGALCRAAGRETAVAGNISPAALTELMQRVDSGNRPDIWVLELSSFQLETTRTLHADAATVLNLTDDHLDRHGDMDAYANAKAAIFAGDGVQVLNDDDERVLAMARAARKILHFSLGEPHAPDQYGLRKLDGETWLCNGDTPLLRLSEMQLAGLHNAANALAALALCEAVGLQRAPLLDGLKKFRGLAHRVELVARRDDGVDFYDDSKGTNVGATLAALQGLGRKVVLIAGGDGKGQDFHPLAAAFREHARGVVLIGRDARRIETETASSGVAMWHAADMDAAVLKANSLAEAGDAVMLSPACASLDMYRNYAHRAQVFCAAVNSLPGVRPA
ncbi:UDP-N-acetylmuramoyl-L-alanine--D-glutamate ligase [Uliginosibacterium sp. H3]|uniref:UDP-N-acetylmuramoylalanine--D-glutamate ligase n=1 Tax=Uliginosibacterium silvisoli TaxID=3114758 RepID=A0ABU6K383_9RHOO|nr:UDP-N-acetylmuramoyl-L-alanine--D-glutamate ligase [Uliginosibacterium sp. H3]